jgi:uncharacterized protein YggE
MTSPLLPLAIGASLLAAALPAVAADQPPPRIVVSGEGESTLRPDLALLSLGVMREAASAREALDANNAAMAAVIAAMKAAGVEERDLQTSSLQIAPRYDYTNKPDGTQEAKLVAYQVSNTLSVRVRDIAKTGEILDKAVTLGVNQGGGISFTNAKPGAALTEARKRAVANAMDKARTLAEAAGVSLGRVLEISDQAVSAMPMPISAKAFDRAEAVPVEAGENAYNVQVTVTFELK